MFRDIFDATKMSTSPPSSFAALVNVHICGRGGAGLVWSPDLFYLLYSYLRNYDQPINITYRVFLKILIHLFSVFEGRQGTCSVHVTKEGFMEICLRACTLSSIRWYNRMKEKRRHSNFTFKQNPLKNKIQLFCAKAFQGQL